MAHSPSPEQKSPGRSPAPSQALRGASSGHAFDEMASSTGQFRAVGAGVEGAGVGDGAAHVKPS